jgi:hypothetical protein
LVGFKSRTLTCVFFAFAVFVFAMSSLLRGYLARLIEIDVVSPPLASFFGFRSRNVLADFFAVAVLALALAAMLSPSL